MSNHHLAQFRRFISSQAMRICHASMLLFVLCFWANAVAGVCCAQVVEPRAEVPQRPVVQESILEPSSAVSGQETATSEPLITRSPSSPQTTEGELPAPVPSVSVPPQSTVDVEDRPYLGLEGEELGGELKGVGVVKVTRNSPAWKAGFQEGDRVIGINGFNIVELGDMVEQLAKAKAGQSMTFLIVRDGRTLELKAVLISLSMADQLQLGSPSDGPVDEKPWVGMSLHDLSESFRAQFGISAYRGAAVSQVISGSPAHRAGIRPGDAITEVDTGPIESASDFVKWLESARPGDQVSMIVYRGIGRRQVTVVLASEPRAKPTPPTYRPNAPRQPSIAKKPGTSSASPTLAPEPGPAVTPDLLNITPPGRESSINTDSSEPMLSETPIATQREVELELEVARLKAELAEVKAKLSEATDQLNNILRALKD